MITNRNQIFAVRTTTDFVQKFDALCDRLGYNRSEVARYCLKKFFNEHFNNPENFKRVRARGGQKCFDADVHPMDQDPQTQGEK